MSPEQGILDQNTPYQDWNLSWETQKLWSRIPPSPALHPRLELLVEVFVLRTGVWRLQLYPPMIPSPSLFPLIHCCDEKVDSHEIWIKVWFISQIRDELNTEWPCCWDVIVVDSSVELGYAIWYVPDNHLDVTIRSNAGYSRRILVSKDNYDYMTIFYNRDSNNLRAIQSNPVG